MGPSRGTIVRAAQGLAVQGNQASLGSFLQRFDPAGEASLKLQRVQRRKYPSEGIVGGNTMRERKERPQPRLLGQAEGLDFGPAVGPADDPKQRDGHDIEQVMELRPVHPRVFDLGKVDADPAGRVCFQQATSQRAFYDAQRGDRVFVPLLSDLDAIALGV